MKTGTWQNGPDLPFPIDATRVVQLGKTFLVVGGYSEYRDDDGHLWSILEFDPVNLQWIRRQERLTYGVNSHYATLVREEDVECN